MAKKKAKNNEQQEETVKKNAKQPKENVKQDTKQPKKLNKTELEKLDKRHNEKFDAEIQGYVLKIDRYFRNSKITKVIDELRWGIDKGREYNIDSTVFGAVYFSFLLIKHFTDLKVPDDFDEQIKMMEILVDNELFNPIIDALPEDQIEKVREKMPQYIENMEQFAEQLANADLQNEDILKPQDTEKH